MSIANLFRLGRLWIEHFWSIDIQLFCEREKVAVVISKVYIHTLINLKS